MALEQEFNNWLKKKLESLGIDDEILRSYISSIVTSDDTYSETKETLKDILIDVTKDLDIDLLCSEVLDKWSEFHVKSTVSGEEKDSTDLANKLTSLMKIQVHPVLKAANRSSEEEKIRQSILSQCNYISVEEEFIAQNQNVNAIVQAERKRREELKTESKQKKAQDKVNREKQKQKQDERREKERKRTQKKECKG